MKEIKPISIIIMENWSLHWKGKNAELKLTLDRIEDDTAVLLLREKEKKFETVKIDMPLFLLPPETKEGDILDIAITIDTKETEAAKERVSSLLEKLKNKNKRPHNDQKINEDEEIE